MICNAQLMKKGLMHEAGGYLNSDYNELQDGHFDAF